LKHLFFFSLALACLVLSSCGTYQKVVYFQDSENLEDSIPNQFNPIFKTDDFLSIVVMGQDTETVVPFNLPILGSPSVSSGYQTGMPATAGYLVDSEGYIKMPVIGRIKIAGLNRQEAIQVIEKKLVDFVSNPVVNIQILNYKITVLGEVKNPGTFKIPNERITLLEAIGLAGDLKITAQRKNILVIRESNGKRQEFRIDLRKKDWLTSPVYYLTQNDVVYVEPNATARYESTLLKIGAPLLISITSLIVTTITLIRQ